MLNSNQTTQVKQREKEMEGHDLNFLLSQFFHFLSIQESKNGSFWQGMAAGREISVPLVCVVPYSQPVLVAV